MGANLKTGLDILFPPLCIGCGEPLGSGRGYCAACWSQVRFLDGPMCECCGLPFAFDAGQFTRCAACLADPPAYDRARAVMAYDEKSRSPVLALKHADRLDLVPQLASWLARAGRVLLEDADVIMPVPLHASRLWRRRYNQAAELARAQALATGKSWNARGLERIRPTESQGAMVSALARRRNVHGAFRVREPSELRGRTVLLIDDVMTTGATVEACARALKRAGAAKVLVLALARVVKASEALI